MVTSGFYDGNVNNSSMEEREEIRRAFPFLVMLYVYTGDNWIPQDDVRIGFSGRVRIACRLSVTNCLTDELIQEVELPVGTVLSFLDENDLNNHTTIMPTENNPAIVNVILCSERNSNLKWVRITTQTFQ